MTMLCVIFRLGLLIGFVTRTSALPSDAETTSLKESQPPASGLRTLTLDESRRANDLDNAIGTALLADRWDEAIAKAEELLRLRTRVQGSKHFETADIEWGLKALRRVAPMSKNDRVAYRSTF